ncbi:uncharacterized protein LOC110442444 [Mizuhopecten yessoensis]|uniref:uncharacterized protein LOC110442444 n=1 Tax=Mizuhopecten yessoensis TaxID=6573 RepID=UPI000B458E2A|nr:uncharacterized protein LOC110442444 [Mizuhopecten yessoensis]
MISYRQPLRKTGFSVVDLPSNADSVIQREEQPAARPVATPEPPIGLLHPPSRELEEDHSIAQRQAEVHRDGNHLRDQGYLCPPCHGTVYKMSLQLLSGHPSTTSLSSDCGLTCP